MNFRHPDPWRVWKGGSEQHLLTPLPGIPRAPLAPLANSKKLICVDSFMHLTHFSVKDVQFSIKLPMCPPKFVQKSRGVFFLREPKRRRQLRHSRKGLGGGLKSLKNYKIHKIHTPKLQGRVFSEGAEAPQAAATQTQRAGGP